MKNIKTQRKNNNAKAKRRSILFVFAVCATAFLAFTSGCGNKFFDPTQVGRFRPVPSVNVILDSLGVADEADVAWSGGEEPRPSDTVVMETDYVFKSGDVVRVTIFELLRAGYDSVNDYVVTETGKVSIPDVGVIEAAGLTETQLEEEIRQILSPSILKDPSVTVTLMASQQRTFSILGDGIPRPGRYGIPRYDFRLWDALATAGGQGQFNVGDIYVSRSTSNGVASPGIGRQAEMLEVISPRAQGRKNRGDDVVIASSEMATLNEYANRRRSAGYASAENLGGLLTNNNPVNDNFGRTVIAGPGANDQPATAIVSEVETGAAADTPDPGLLWEEPAENEQVSVGDILKTLAERSRQDSTSSATAPTLNGSEPATLPQRTPVSQNDSRSSTRSETPSIDLRMPADNLDAEPETSAGGQASELDSIMKTLGERPRSTRLDDGAPVMDGVVSPTDSGPGDIEEPRGVENILNTLEARTGQSPAKEQVEWEGLLESFAEPESPQAEPESPQAEPEAEQDMDLNELLKSFSEPGGEVREPDTNIPDTGVRDIGIQNGEQFGPEDVSLDIDVPSAVEEPGVGLDDLGISFAPGVGGRSEDQTAQAPGRIEWVFQDGKWVPMQIGAPSVARPVIQVDSQFEPSRVDTEAPMGGMDWGAGAERRLIKIPADRLMAGDPKYNIVIKPGDSIYVPVDVIGEFCIMGNVVRQGYIPITGRPLTLKMAIAAAGGLGPLAWPKRVEVVRRVGEKKEETVMVDLDKIYSGEQPDFFIKPNDLINVGTHATSRWLAVLRNSFRATYGFGFVYDRNFADRDYGNSPWPF